MFTETFTVTKKISKNDVLRFISKYHNANHRALVTQVPINEENMTMIRLVQKVIGIPLHLRWRGPGWKSGYHTKEGATNVSVYARDRDTSFKVGRYSEKTIHVSVLSCKKITTDWEPA